MTLSNVSINLPTEILGVRYSNRQALLETIIKYNYVYILL